MQLNITEYGIFCHAILRRDFSFLELRGQRNLDRGNAIDLYHCLGVEETAPLDVKGD